MPSLNKPLKEDEKKKYILHAILFKKNIINQIVRFSSIYIYIVV